MWDLEEYATDLRARKQSEGTVRLRVYHLQRFAAAHPDPWGVAPGDVAGRLAGCRSPEYAKSVRSSLNSFYLWAVRRGLTERNPMLRVAPVQVPRARARPCPEPVYAAALLRADPAGMLMLRLMAESGLRCMEVAGLHTRDFDGGAVLVHGKGGHARTVPVTAEAARLLSAVPPGWVLPGRGGGPMRPGSVGRAVARLLGDGWTAHTLRHRCGTRAYARTSDLISVQRLLGHASVATTQRYIGGDDEGMRRCVAAAAGP